MISIKANCIDSTVAPEAVFDREVNALRAEMFEPLEQIAGAIRARSRDGHGYASLVAYEHV